ncbi:MAG TPA: DUF4339 domain-containing protein [Verrucomicrobiae bacterium]
MKFEVRRQGENLGAFSLEELHRRRDAGELTGGEYVQAEGMPDWQPLDLVLQRGYSTPPPLPPSAPNSREPSPVLVWAAIVLGAIFFVVAFVLFVRNVQKVSATAIRQSQVGNLNQPRPQAIAAASKPVVWTTNTLTQTDANKRAREFRLRQWLEGYEKRGQHQPALDAEAEQFIRVWIARNYGGPEETNTLSLSDESDKLAGDPRCTDPLVLTVAADESLNYFDAVHRFQRALAAYPQSLHQAYPQFYATVKLAQHWGGQSDRVGALETSALQLLPKCFADGSFTPADQQEIAHILVNGWGYGFFQRNSASVCAVVHEVGPSWQWLALTLDGEREIITAWAARGNGYANTVSEQGWGGFRQHLASARTALTAAWNLQPGWPLAPERMIYVSLGDSDVDEMRTWFDRTTVAQIDYSRAWSDLRWGLRPRWYGNEASLLALGVAAVNSGRFDTDAPRKYVDCIYDVESEMQLPAGRHIFGHSDVWPVLQRVYEGYIRESQPNSQSLREWRTSYAVIAYLAGKYDVGRAQLEALDWKPLPGNMSGWSVDLSLMPLEVAARTGPLGGKVSKAESLRAAGDVSAALKTYSDVQTATGADARTREFVQRRISQLTVAQRLQTGEWVELLPTSDNDPDWVFSFGQTRCLPEGALEVESGARGHLLFSRARVGADFEVRGQFEVVHSANTNFQAGVVMGVPDFDGYNWYGFRLKRHDEEGDSVCLGRGWSQQQITRHIVLNDVTNAFDFIFRNGKVTASVNGAEVFHQAAPPAEIGVPDNSYLVGIGAFSDSPDTVIRYRGVQMRQLR